MDKAARNGIRIADLLDAEEFERKVRLLVAEKKNVLIEQVYGSKGLDADSIVQEYLGYARSCVRTSRTPPSC